MGAYVGNTYGAGPGIECLDDVLCAGDEQEFKDCFFSIDDHADPSQDVSIQCSPGMILTVSVTVRTNISIVRMQSSWTAAADVTIIVLPRAGVVW